MISPMNRISAQSIFPGPVIAMMLAEFKSSCVAAKEVVYIIVSASLVL